MMVQVLWKQNGGVSKGKKNSYDPTIPLLDTDPKEPKAGSQSGICMPTFTALLIVSKTYKHPEYPWTDEPTGRRTWSTHIMEKDLAFKWKQTLTLATTWMNLEGIMQNEVSHSQKDKQCDSTYMRSSKSSETEEDRRDGRQNGGCQRQGEGE